MSGGETPQDSVLLFAPRHGGLSAPSLLSGVVTPGRLLSAMGSEIGLIALMDGAHCDIAAIPIGHLARRLAERLDRPLPQALNFLPTNQPTHGTAAALRAALSTLFLARAAPGTSSDSAAITGLAAVLVDLALDALPHNFSDALRAPAVKIAPAQVRRALTHIHANPLPVGSIEDLARVCNVSARSLQYAFRDFVGMAPAEYWRRYRAKRALEDMASAPAVSAADIAAKWSFTNMTRFRAFCRDQGLDTAILQPPRQPRSSTSREG